MRNQIKGRLILASIICHIGAYFLSLMMLGTTTDGSMRPLSTTDFAVPGVLLGLTFLASIRYICKTDWTNRYNFMMLLIAGYPRLALALYQQQHTINADIANPHYVPVSHETVTRSTDADEEAGSGPEESNYDYIPPV